MQRYRLEDWQHRHWQTSQRWYSADLTQDLFGQWQVRTSWGGRFNRIAGEQSKTVEGPEEGVKLLQATAKRRQQRGYLEAV